MKVVLGLIGFICVQLVCGQDDPAQQCTEGSEWNDGCNNCWCGPGGTISCTKKACRDDNQSVGSCKDGSRWLQDNCNWCSCFEGKAACTLRYCPPEPSTAASDVSDGAESRTNKEDGVARSSVGVPAPVCEPTGGAGDRFREACNWCRCSSRGMGMCTRRGCSPALREHLKGTPECEGAPRWKKHCNWCSCRNGTAVCTEIGCLGAAPVAAEEGDEEEVAASARIVSAVSASCNVTEPSDRWLEGCNWCRCAEGRAACTKRGCSPGILARLSSGPQCEGAPRWRQDCNWCSCSDGQAVCTKRACINRSNYPQRVNAGSKTPSSKEASVSVPAPSDYEPECVAGSSWTESCNTCSCSGGHSTCTLKACFRAVPDSCTAGSVWRRGCSRCRCEGGAPACDAAPCEGHDAAAAPASPSTVAGVGVEGASCVRGSRWRKDACNWCSCDDGRGVCTQRACIAGSGSVASPLDCVEGSSWSDGCNTCYCSNGVSACTLLYCHSDTDPGHGQAVAPDMTRPQIQDRPRPHGQAVIPDMTRPQVQDRPHGRQLSPDIPSDSTTCVPGTRYYDGCNWCTCTTTGVSACTMRACFQTSVRAQPSTDALTQSPSEPLRADATCTEGSRWKQDCNWCTCQNGRGACTLRGCIPGRTSDSPQCEEGSRWKADCNWCQCTSGGLAVCTLMACAPTRSSSDTVREHGQAVAPDMTRPQIQDRLRPHGQAVIPDMTRPQVQDRPRGRQLSPDIPSDSTTCVPGTRYYDGCNWCTCTTTGVSACTMRACFQTSQRAQPSTDALTQSVSELLRADATCIEGSRWKQDCNWCTCQNGRGACTLKACIPGRTSDGPQCEEGSRWKADCNWCQCTSGGLAVCTLMACAPTRLSTDIAPDHGEAVIPDMTRPQTQDRPQSHGQAVIHDMTRPQVQDRPQSHGQAVIPDMTRPQVQDRPRPHGQAVIPDMTRPQVQDRPRPHGQAVIPDMTRPQVQDRPKPHGQAVIPDMTRPQIQDRPRPDGQAVIPDMTRPQIQDIPRPDGQAVAPDVTRPQVQERPRGKKVIADFPERTIDIPRDDRTCVPGSRYFDGCNWCTCTSTGVTACTLKACFDTQRDIVNITRCEEGSRFKIDCNWCNCVNGGAACTQMACLSASLRARPSTDALTQSPSEQLRADATCTEGSRWKQDCNWCTCQNGRGACTLKGCIPGRTSDGPQCEEGSRWKADCNWCQCTSGGLAVCTLMACAPPRSSSGHSLQSLGQPEHSEAVSSSTHPGAIPGAEGKECTPGSKFRHRCNWCSCSAEGRKLCTRKMCAPEAAASTESSCVGDALYLDEDNCNWCRCYDGHAACTDRLCHSRPGRGRSVSVAAAGAPVAAAGALVFAAGASPPPGDECQGTQTWMEECNRCRCSNGHKTCTRRLCFQRPNSAVSHDRCLLPADSGMCFASIRAFRFNADPQRCEEFLYGGCGGNANRFTSSEDCRRACGELTSPAKH